MALPVSNWETECWNRFRYNHNDMAASQTLLCIYREPGQLNLLREKGYELITTSNGRDGLRLVMSRSVDGIVLEGLLNGAGVADEIKRVRPRLPIVMIAENLELPDGALRSVDGPRPNPMGLSFCWRLSAPYCGQGKVPNPTARAQNRQCQPQPNRRVGWQPEAIIEQLRAPHRIRGAISTRHVPIPRLSTRETSFHFAPNTVVPIGVRTGF